MNTIFLKYRELYHNDMPRINPKLPIRRVLHIRRDAWGIVTEEIFGPVLAIERQRINDQTIRMATESLYALTGGLYSRSPAKILKVKEEFVLGNLYINSKITGAFAGRQPLGGFGMSGIGSKAGGPANNRFLQHSRRNLFRRLQFTGCGSGYPPR